MLNLFSALNHKISKEGAAFFMTIALLGFMTISLYQFLFFEL